MFRYLAGMSPLEPGFRRVRFAPNFVSMVNHVRAEHQAPAGKIVSEWRRENGVIRLYKGGTGGAKTELSAAVLKFLPEYPR